MVQTLNLLTHKHDTVFNPVNLVFLFLSMQYIKLTTYYHIFVKQLITDFSLFQSHLLSQNGNNTVLWMLFVIMSRCHDTILQNVLQLSSLGLICSVWYIYHLCVCYTQHTCIYFYDLLSFLCLEVLYLSEE